MTANLVPIRPSTQAPTSVTMGLSPVLRMPLPGGDRGTEATIARIRKLVHDGMTDQGINRMAIAIVQAAGIQQFDFVGEIRAIFDWVRRNIRFTRDITGIETLRTAREVLTVRAGDCDDINGVLLPSLLGSIGHELRLVTISSDPEDPRVFSHIYCEVEISGQWVPLDSARRDPAFGKGPRNYFRKRVWSLTNGSFQDVQGLGFYGRRKRNGRLAFDWGDLSDVIGSAGTATAQIISSLNVPRLPGVAYAQNPAGGLVPISPTGQLYASTGQGGINFGSSGTLPNWMLYGGLGLLALLVARR